MKKNRCIHYLYFPAPFLGGPRALFEGCTLRPLILSDLLDFFFFTLCCRSLAEAYESLILPDSLVIIAQARQAQDTCSRMSSALVIDRGEEKSLSNLVLMLPDISIV